MIESSLYFKTISHSLLDLLDTQRGAGETDFSGTEMSFLSLVTVISEGLSGMALESWCGVTGSWALASGGK